MQDCICFKSTDSMQDAEKDTGRNADRQRVRYSRDRDRKKGGIAREERQKERQAERKRERRREKEKEQEIEREIECERERERQHSQSSLLVVGNKLLSIYLQDTSVNP